MSALHTNLRRQLENAIKQARKIAEGAARKALEALAVHEPDPYRHMDEPQRDLRRKLRAQAKQMGDGESQTRPGAYEIKHLVEKLAYDQWHRLLFARFLLENNLLISPEHGVSISLDDCEELAPSVELKDAWAVAARFAAKELPEICRADDPAGAVDLPVEDRKQLIQLVTGLPVEVFTASDSLGWCYQFWQAERKDEVNAAGNKIGADELPAVTQLFTEDYMVDFLLDNTLGAWRAGKVFAANPKLAESAESEEELRQAMTLPGCPWKYLRFIKASDGKWTPAAGKFGGWPKRAKELKCLDPCMGSGHFMVAMFERLVALCMAEEIRDEATAVAAVIRDNLFGLEIDPRCTQIGAFNLALAAWRRIGHCKLPAMNLACSGRAPNAKKEDWLKLAGDNERLQNGMERLYLLFRDAPVLGSLINPRADGGDLLVATFHQLQPLLEKALVQETKDDTEHEMTVTARGLAKAAEILTDQFTLVATNVPYLRNGKHGSVLKEFCENSYPKAKADLATVFVERCVQFCSEGGRAALVTPQAWLFLGSYKKFRAEMLTDGQWSCVARLGSGAFETVSGEVVNVALMIVSRQAPSAEHSIAVMDVDPAKTVAEKAQMLGASAIHGIRQLSQLRNPDARFTFEEGEASILLLSHAECYAGIQNGDSPRFQRLFWETVEHGGLWHFQQATVGETTSYGGRSMIILYDRERGHLREEADIRRVKLHDSDQRGNKAWGRLGIVVSQMNELKCSIYTGELYDQSCAVIVPHFASDVLPIWAFCYSPEFNISVRRIDRKLNVTNATLVKIPFDLAHWQKVAAKVYPEGLPKPLSSDPTQWLFNGHPKGSDQPLHVAVARLLGYRWPRQTGSSFVDCPALGLDGLEKLVDTDGIVCLSATKGNAPAAERLRSLLAQVSGKFDLGALIASAGLNGGRSETLEEWLRDEFFEQHCEIFHHRPFIWHLWDGHKSGFSALVNYHQLTHVNLEKLTYAYLGDWIRRQQAGLEEEEAGSDARLQAAKQLQTRLKLILEGEPPYDLFARWKPLSKQAIGWHPDMNDGVRVNIRPFLAQDIPGGRKGAGILRIKPNVKWDKDRGKEPTRDKKDFPWFWGWDEKTQDFAGVGKEPDGNRWNDCHYTNEFKLAANKAR
ncbi:MAG TPA: N-6 DNA methylase [Terriglobales bacterium]|nr:N-6 DNA methylase [Terriglobales bacterium]